jgi:predicted O-linked N-acetylglucosamine transferase (SPINDLY family)
VGLLSSHLGDHPVGHHIGGWLRNADAGAWEVLCFSGAAGGGGGADLARNAALCAGGAITPLPADAGGGARALAAAGLDLLLTLDGYDRGHRAATLAALARLPNAPYSIGWFGFLGTLGAPYVPALLGDTAVAPEGDEPLLSEALVLRHPSTFFVADYAALSPGVPAAPPYAPPPPPTTRGGAFNFTFCCFSQLWKATPAVARAWLSVLARAPGATLLLMEHPPVSRAGLAATHGAHPAWGRVAFLPLLPRGEHLLVKRARCGLGLDTSPYNGHVTTADLLWAGVPVLTFAPPGAGMAGRAAASLLRAAGAPPAFFAATSLAAYEDAAVRVYQAYADAAGAPAGAGGGGDPLLWRPLPSAPLFDAAAWTRGFEATLRAAFDDDGGEL